MNIVTEVLVLLWHFVSISDNFVLHWLQTKTCHRSFCPFVAFCFYVRQILHIWKKMTDSVSPVRQYYIVLSNFTIIINLKSLLNLGYMLCVVYLTHYKCCGTKHLICINGNFIMKSLNSIIEFKSGIKNKIIYWHIMVHSSLL